MPTDDDKTKRSSEEDFLNEFREEAHGALRELRAYRTYQGSDADRRNRAKIFLGLLGGYVRFRATRANERTNELVTQRLLADANIKQLPPSDDQP